MTQDLRGDLPARAVKECHGAPTLKAERTEPVHFQPDHCERCGTSS